MGMDIGYDCPVEMDTWSGLGHIRSPPSWTGSRKCSKYLAILLETFIPYWIQMLSYLYVLYFLVEYPPKNILCVGY
jgi:hypothetical protein